MGKSELKQQIMDETQNLPFNTLVKILNFIQFLKVKNGSSQESIEEGISEELSELNQVSLGHLEEEFENYKKLYPYE